MKLKSIFFSIIVLLTISACGPYTHHPVRFGQKAIMPEKLEAEQPPPQTLPSIVITYAEVREIFQAKCSLCHNPGTGGNPPNWLDYSVAAGRLNSIKNRVFVVKDMPVVGMPELTEEEARKLKAWLDAGAPE